MNEKQVKKRNWIKNAVIIFLTVMLLLTFFSNTILNYSLPEVAIQYVQNGSITSKIRGTGTIISGDPYQVEINESRVIGSVAVKQGQEVQIGDILFLLEDQESQELADAEKQLESLTLEFQKAILSGEISQQAANNAQHGSTASVEAYQAKINAAKNEVAKMQKKVDEWQQQVTALTNQITISSNTTADTTNEQKALNAAQANLTNAQTALTTAQNNVATLEATLKTYSETILTLEQAKADEQAKLDALNAKIAVSGGDANNYAAEQAAYDRAVAYRKLIESYAAAQAALVTATEKVGSAQVAVTNAQTALDNKKATGDNSTVLANLERQKAIAQVNLAEAQKNLDNANNNLTQVISDIQSELNLGAQSDAIRAQQELVNKLRENSVGAQVTAPVAGTVTSVSYVAGETTKPGEPAIVIQPAGKGFSMSFSVTNEQARTLNVGTAAELVNAWYYNDIKATLASIKPDPENPGKNKILTFDIEGDVVAGQSLTLSVGDKSANYDLIVPNSAIREDNNGKFVLMVESKPSPVGTRYTATRVDVQVLASDDTKSAISGALYGWGEAIITTSTKPVTAGQQVRLANN